jgi:hypothetical protein
MAWAIALGACAIADVRPGVVQHETPKQIWSRFHGPDVLIRATVMSTRGARLIQPTVHLADSAYLVIGDIGDDGTLRILYPARPGDSNFVRKTRAFDGPRFQPRVILPFMERSTAVARTASGYAFVIASSLPLQLDKLAEGERWSLFDVYYDDHMSDPRPAITDLAAAISTDVGQVAISYAPYSWGLVGSRETSAQQSTPTDPRRRLPRPP